MWHMARILVTAILAAVVAVLALPGSALAATEVVRYHGVRVTVPANWPVFHLGAGSSVCVRFNRHAVYLGVPGTDQVCPVQAVGRTEAILISPEIAGTTAAAPGRDGLTPVSVLGAAPADGSMARVVDSAHHVVITATWGRDPAAIRAALGLHSLRAAMLATNGRRPAVARATVRPRAAPRETSAASPATPGEVYNGLGFDTCTTPSQSSMSAWSSASPFGAVGIYIGGANAACLGGNLNAAWVTTESAAGWHMIPTYVGLQSPTVSGCSKCATISATTAASEGTAAAQDAVAQAQALGIGTGNPIYDDMEGYTRTTAATTAVLTFLEAWTEQLHTSGYLSGVYSSAGSGIADLADQVGSSYVEPDEIWIADWSDPDGTQTTADPYVPAADWANNQRLHQYQGAQTESYGGVAINVDSDYLEGVTAAAGSAAPAAPPIPATPSITVSPEADGSVELTPTWAGEPGITEFQVLAGDSAQSMTPVSTIPATQTIPAVVNDAYSYFEVAALNSTGAVVGTSAAVPTPPSAAIFGSGAFVSSRGSVGIPVACLNSSFCQLTAAIYIGKRLLTAPVTKTMSIHGGVIRLSLTKRAREIVAAEPRHRLPVRVSIVSRDGMKAKRMLTLNQYTVAGMAPLSTTKASSTLQILGKSDFVSNGWAGGILAVCTASTPCNASTRVTDRSGALIATVRAQTLGAGEIGYLWFTLTAKGHALLRASKGNQLGVRLAVTTATAPNTSGGATVGTVPVARALLSLDSY